jgi:NhaA family Na+:H+ antiporter
MAASIQQWLRKPFERFLAIQGKSGILLLLVTGLALLWANLPWMDSYHRLAQAAHGMVNDGLMAIFFLLVGLEIKRELVEGELSSPRQAAFPLLAAAGGMLVPGMLYWLINVHSSTTLSGWGIPTVTDIAFALGILQLLGNRVPIGLKVFLAALAIADDLGAILLIALFYAKGLQPLALAGMGVVLLGLFGLNRRHAQRALPYLLLGGLLWFLTLHSGLHATLAGVLLALMIPARPRPEHPNADECPSLLHRLEAALNPWASYGILPLFALVNAGISLPWPTLAADPGSVVLHPVTLGIIVGLCLGKPVGILLFSGLAVRLGWAVLPEGIRWIHIAGAGLLAGIGFTMSLFITHLAFQEPTLLLSAKLGILCASSLSAVLGAALLARTLQRD